MELTEENLDYPDCMPPREHNSIKVRSKAPGRARDPEEEAYPNPHTKAE
jgi:hypothetical protein